MERDKCCTSSNPLCWLGIGERSDVSHNPTTAGAPAWPEITKDAVDVAIVGGGPGGAYAAYLLKKRVVCKWTDVVWLDIIHLKLVTREGKKAY